MERVSEKLVKELKPGTRIISHGFPLPGWKIETEKEHLYLHIKT
jgi:hypothetical protein